MPRQYRHVGMLDDVVHHIMRVVAFAWAQTAPGNGRSSATHPGAPAMITHDVDLDHRSPIRGA
ncbi:MAG: hypothetical protein EPN31_15695 [Castellaniella sp.]|uniref:hypothetical protein n=1 Tax=Castellaniella sp. TaxID=1955812 RepID=UPI001204DED2|nr:hypothetical protein [Castellaniella sp.]TAN25186.1 MAG: hypothetical protein EPN31_15695 [Castellaniella sp.]